MPRVRWLSLLHRPISFKDRSGLQAHGEGAHQQCAQTHPKRLTRQQRIRCFLSSNFSWCSNSESGANLQIGCALEVSSSDKPDTHNRYTQELIQIHCSSG